MISLKNITLKDFTIIKDLFIDFTQGMFFVITGDNGSGKSSLINALAVTFFEYRSGDSFREYVRFGCEQAKILLNAELHGKPIKFDITLHNAVGKSPLERKVYFDGKEYINSEVKTFLADNFDLPVIENIMFSIQKEFGSISTMSPSQFRDMLQSMFNISFENEIKTIEEKIEVYKSEILDYEAKIKVLDHTKYDLEDLKTLASDDQIESVKNELDLSKSKLKLYKQEVVYSNIRDRYTENETTISKLIEQKQNLNNSSSKNKAEDLTNKLKLLQSIVEKSKSNHAKSYEALNELQKEKESIVSNTNLLKHKYEALLKEDSDHRQGLCTKCHRPYSAQEVHDFESLVNTSKSEYETSFKKLQELDSNYSKIKSDFDYETKSIQKDENEITKLLSEISQEEKSSNAINLKLTAISSQLDSLIEENRRNESAYQESLSVEKVSESDIRKLEDLIKNGESFLSIEQVKRDRNLDIQLRNKALLEKKELDQKMRNEFTIKVNENNIKINSAKKAIDILSVDMVNHVIVRMCSELEDYINEFIDSIKANLRVKLLKTKKGVELFVTPNSASSDSPNEWSSIKMCSGFEKDLISLAFKVALARAYKLKILILDEIDSAATSENSGRLFSLISKITDFEVILIVSHKDSVKHVLLEEAQNVVSYEVTNGVYELSS